MVIYLFPTNPSCLTFHLSYDTKYLYCRLGKRQDDEMTRRQKLFGANDFFLKPQMKKESVGFCDPIVYIRRLEIIEISPQL